MARSKRIKDHDFQFRKRGTSVYWTPPNHKKDGEIALIRKKDGAPVIPIKLTSFRQLKNGRLCCDLAHQKFRTKFGMRSGVHLFMLWQQIPKHSKQQAFVEFSIHISRDEGKFLKNRWPKKKRSPITKKSDEEKEKNFPSNLHPIFPTRYKIWTSIRHALISFFS